MTPTARSLKALRDRGATPAKVEYFNPGTRRLHDLYGFIDIVALEPGVSGVLAIQTTSGSNVAARLAKIAQEARAGLWLACGNRIVIHGWRKGGPRGRRKTWALREVVVTAEALASAAPQARP